MILSDLGGWDVISGKFNDKEVIIKTSQVTDDYIMQGDSAVLDKLQDMYNKADGFAGLTFPEFAKKVLL